MNRIKSTRALGCAGCAVRWRSSSSRRRPKAPSRHPPKQPATPKKATHGALERQCSIRVAIEPQVDARRRREAESVMNVKRLEGICDPGGLFLSEDAYRPSSPPSSPGVRRTSLLLHRIGLAPITPCRSPGAQSPPLAWYRSRFFRVAFAEARPRIAEIKVDV